LSRPATVVAAAGAAALAGIVGIAGLWRTRR
jgi:hypothetical protein